ncbi:MAG: hypothetical protein AB1782_07160 [Cyanobacteriota bacterium]
MEKFVLYSNDPYDFNDIEQIKEFYKLRSKDDILKKINDGNKDKIFIKILADKKENSVEISLIQDRKSESGKIKLPDLVLDYEELKLKDVEKYLDLSEYLEFD